MNLSDAISAVEQGQQAYQSAAVQTVNDQAIVEGIKVKLDAADQTVAADQAMQGSAAGVFNSALDGLIEAAQSAKIPAPAPPVHQ